MNIYIYILKLTKRLYDDHAWTDNDNQIVEQHFYRLKHDFELGIVLSVGRTEDPKDDGFGLVIYQVKDDLDAKKYMENDPAVKEGLMTATYFPYKHILY